MSSPVNVVWPWGPLHLTDKDMASYLLVKEPARQEKVNCSMQHAPSSCVAVKCTMQDLPSLYCSL